MKPFELPERFMKPWSNEATVYCQSKFRYSADYYGSVTNV